MLFSLLENTHFPHFVSHSLSQTVWKPNSSFTSLHKCHFLPKSIPETSKHLPISPQWGLIPFLYTYIAPTLSLSNFFSHCYKLLVKILFNIYHNPEAKFPWKATLLSTVMAPVGGADPGTWWAHRICWINDKHLAIPLVLCCPRIWQLVEHTW